LSAAVAAQTPGAEGLVALVGGEMFRTAIQALTLTSNATHQGELIALVRDILMRTTSEHDPPQQFLLSLRGVTREVFVEFKSKLASTLSQKDQRVLIKKLLVHAGECYQTPTNQLHVAVAMSASITYYTLIVGSTI
jgi:hypothetical protein